MLAFREGQLRDEPKSGGIQSANISMINRRFSGSASARALAEKQHQPHVTLGQDTFSLVDTVSHIRQLITHGHPCKNGFADSFSQPAGVNGDTNARNLAREQRSVAIVWKMPGEVSYACTPG